MNAKRIFATLFVCFALGFSFVTNAQQIRLSSATTGGAGDGTVVKSLVAVYDKNQAIGVMLPAQEANIGIAITNNAGKVAYSNTVDSSQASDVTINVSTLPAGVYKISFKDQKTGATLSGEFAVN